MPFLLAMGLAKAEILLPLGPGTALYDSDIRGIANDNDSAGSQSGIPVLGNNHHPAGFSFHVSFTPAEADLFGTVLLIEIGGTSNGVALVLVDGVPTVISKQGGTADLPPDSLSDPELPAIAVQSAAGVLNAGISYSFSASWNHIRNLELIVKPESGAPVTTLFRVDGNPGNWSGNDTLSVGTPASVNGSRGSFTGGTGANTPPFGVNTLTAFAGEIHRALFWNEHAITSLLPEPPEIAGFAATWLDSSNQVRLHWDIADSGLTQNVEVILSAGETELHRSSDPYGFVDVSASRDAVFQLRATNDAGTDSATSQVAVDTPFSARVRASNPVAWFRFNEPESSTLFVDSADNAAPHNGRPHGSGLSSGSGFIDGSLVLNGAGAVVSNLILNPSAAADPGYTIETIILRHTGNTAATPSIVSQTDRNGIGRFQLVATEDGSIVSLFENTRREADEKLPADSWAHLVLVVDGINAQLRWYLDGELIGSTDGLDDPVFLESSEGDWVFGAGKGLAGNYWKGEFDDIVIYDHLLDDPDGDGNLDDSLIAAHRDAWWGETSGLIHFGSSSPVIVKGDSAELIVKTGPDVTSVTIDNGVGTLTPVNGIAKVVVSPETTTTYQVAVGEATASVKVTVSDNSLLVAPLDASAALYDSDRQGFANDQTIVGTLDDAHHIHGFTFNVIFTPAEEDLSGTALLIEIGGSSNGVALVLVDGIPTVVSKQSSGGAAYPDSANDTSLPVIAVQSGIGALEAGTSYSFAAAWNHLGTLELAVRPTSGSTVATPFAITGNPGNWSGNDTISIGIPAPSTGSWGAFSSTEGTPFSFGSLQAFTGGIHRALFWNDYAFVTPPTPPVVEGFEATRLPGTGLVRLHWGVSGGLIPSPVEVVLSTGSTELHRSTDTTGFVDVEADDSATFTLGASTDSGSAEATATVAEENPFSSVVRASEPVAWFRFLGAEGSKLVVDSAVNASPRNGLSFGGVTFGGQGPVDGAASFDGTGGVVSDFILNPAATDPGFTIEAVVQRRSPAGGGTTNRVIFNQQDLNGTGRSLIAVDDNGRINNFLANKANNAASPLYNEGWAHLVVVVDALAPELRWYLDGELIGSGQDSGLILESSDGKWTIGVHKSLTQSFWLGDIDDLAVYDYLLDDPDGDGELSDSRIGTHRDAWWRGTSGLIHFGSSSDRIVAGGQVQLIVRVGADITSVTVNGVGTVVPENGRAVFTVSPTGTTTYQVTATGSSGSYTESVTITVDPAPAGELRVLSSTLEGGEFVIHFTGEPSTTYAVRGSTDLVSFGEDHGIVTTDSEGLGTARIPVGAGQPRRFFRIEDQP